MQIDWNQAVVTTALTAIVTGSINYFIYRFQKKIDFKEDYKRIILKSRKDAYTKLENLINVMSQKRTTEDLLTIHRIFNKTADALHPLHDFIQQLVDIFDEAIWINDDTLRKLKEIHKYFLSVYMLSRKDYTEDHYKIAGRANYKKVEEMRNELRIVMMTDLKNLHDIDNFLKDKKFKY
jgi:hypothetical protein